MDAKLKECPFCGSPAELEDHRTVWAVKCTSSACATIMLGDRAPEPDGEMGDAYWNGIKQTAIDRWNARAIAPPVAAGSVDALQRFEPYWCNDQTAEMDEYPDGDWLRRSDVIVWGAQQLDEEENRWRSSVEDYRRRAEKAEARVKELEVKAYNISDFITIKNGQDITSMMKNITRSSDSTGELRITSACNGIARTIPDGRIQIIFDGAVDNSSGGVVVHSSNDEQLRGWSMPGFDVRFQEQDLSNIFIGE